MTEFEEKQAKLAKFLFELYHGEGSWESQPELHGNYRLDAQDVLLMQPHLLSVPERVRMWRTARHTIKANLNEQSVTAATNIEGWGEFYEDFKDDFED